MVATLQWWFVGQLGIKWKLGFKWQLGLQRKLGRTPLAPTCALLQRLVRQLGFQRKLGFKWQLGLQRKLGIVRQSRFARWLVVLPRRS